MVAGDVATAKTILRDYINATVGFTELSEETHIPSKSLMRMLGPSGNPRAGNLLQIVRFLQQREGRLPLAVGERIHTYWDESCSAILARLDFLTRERASFACGLTGCATPLVGNQTLIGCVPLLQRLLLELRGLPACWAYKARISRH
jgi:hypothetical protein